MAAIYMWFDDEQMVLTTTLYPIEAVDAQTMSADVSLGLLYNIDEDDIKNSGEFLGGLMPVILITYGPDEEDIKNAGDLTSITMPVILISYGPDEEDIKNAGDLMGISMPLKLVDVFAPDQMMRNVCDVNPSACSMTTI